MKSEVDIINNLSKITAIITEIHKYPGIRWT